MFSQKVIYLMEKDKKIKKKKPSIIKAGYLFCAAQE